MEKAKIKIGNKSYNCWLAETEEDKKKGLMGAESLPEGEGMLFIWDEEDTREMWMKDTKIPLDQIAINDDDVVVSVYKAKPEDETLIKFKNAKYILEVNQNSGIKKGDELEFDDDGPVMKVLAPDGSAQMELWGGERIFRRAFTFQLIKLCKKADLLKKTYGECDELNSLYKRIGRKMFKEIQKQDSRPPEYVNLPE